MPEKILFLKKAAAETRAASAVIGASGFHWRIFASAADVAAALQRERFQLVVVDHRGATDDSLQFINQLPEMPAGTPIFLITAQQFELQKVIQAIRLGVKDMFHPPLDLKAIVDRARAILKSVPGSNVPELPLDEWSEFVMFLAEGEDAAVGGGAKRPAGKGTAGELAARLSLVTQERDQLAAERDRLRSEAARLEVRVENLEGENGRLLSEGQRMDPAGQAGAASPGTTHPVPADSSAIEERLEAEQAALAQQQGKFAQEVAAWRDSCAKGTDGQAKREQEFDEHRKHHAEAVNKFATEQEEFEAAQLVADQAQTKVEQVVLELAAAADKLKEQRVQMAVEQRAADEELTRRTAALQTETEQLARDREELTALLDKLENEKNALLEREMTLEEVAATTMNQASRLKKAEAQLAIDRVTLGAEKSAQEKAAKSLVERAQQFDAKQQQVREQMKQLLAAGA